MTASAQATPAADDLPWWLGVVQGIALVVLGLLCLGAPGKALLVVVQLAGIYWLVTGILGLVSVIGDRTMWVWKLLGGIVGILAGVAIIQHPIWAAVLVPSTLILVVGILGIVSGSIGLIQSIGERSWAGALLGVFGVIIGLILVMNPAIGAATLPFVVGIFGLIGGIMALVAAFAERGDRRRRAQAAAPDLTSPSVAAPTEPPAPPAEA
jgi:uncharacterized membrane protein HdeD (DUF308 family)